MTAISPEGQSVDGATHHPPARVEGNPLHSSGIHPLSSSRIQRLRTARILIVEDEPAVAIALSDMFRIGFGCEVDLAVNGVNAFERLSNQTYSLVLSDVRMPEMSGTELYLWLCEAQPNMAKHFVFVTAHAEDRHFETKLVEWGVPILSKPFTLSDLLAICEPALEPAGAS